MRTLLIGSFAVLLTLGLFQSMPIRAEAQANTSAANPADVYISNLTLSSGTYPAGGIAQGSFVLENDSDQPVSGIDYVVVLTSPLTYNIADKAYDQKKFGPYMLSAHEKKSVTFQYVLPSGVAGDLNIRVRAVTENGFLMGWMDQAVTVTGQSTTNSVSIDKGTVIINAKEFQDQVGPMAYPGDTASYSVQITNHSSGSLTLVPTLKLFKKSLSGSTVPTATASPVTLKAGETKTVAFSLPTNLDPEVYAGEAQFMDANGQPLSDLSSFQYIIAGDILTIQSVKTDEAVVTAGQPFTFSLAYTGTPVDITGTHPYVPVGAATAHVVLNNDQGALLGESDQTVVFELSEGLETISIPASTGSDSASVQIIVSKDGKQLTTFSAPLIVPAPATSLWAGRAPLVVLGSIVALLLIGFAWRRKPAAALLALFVIGCGFAFSANHASASALQVTEQHSYTDGMGHLFDGVSWAPRVFVNTPHDTLLPGEKFYLTGDIDISACLNKPSNVGYMVKYLDTGSWVNMGTTTRSAVNSNDHAAYTYTDQFTCGAGSGAKCITNSSQGSPGMQFTAPTTPGTYKIYMKVTNDPKIADLVNEVAYGWVEGYIQFTVAPSDSDPTKGDVQIQALNSDGSAHALSPRYLSRFWNDDGGTGSYFVSANVTGNSVWFKNRDAGNGYTTSLDTAYGATPPPYVQVSLGTVGRFFASLSGKILAFFDRAPRAFADTSGDSRSIPTDPKVGSCMYDRGSAECNPTSFQPLQLRSLPSCPTCFVDLYYQNGGFNVVAGKVTKVVYQWGNTNGGFDFDMSNGGDKTIAPNGQVGNTVSVKSRGGDDFEPVTLSVTSVSGTGVSVALTDSNSCTKDCTRNLSITASADAVPSSIPHVVTIQGTTGGVTHTTSFNVIVTNNGTGVTVADCWPSVVNPLTGQVIEHATEAAVNQEVTWHSSVQGGVPPYSYVWSGTDGLTGNTATTVKRYSRVGKKTADVFVVDANGTHDEKQCAIEPVISLNPDWGQF